MDVSVQVLIDVNSNMRCIFQNDDLARKIGDLIRRTKEVVTMEEEYLIEA
jgi:hypothetical protein